MKAFPQLHFSGCISAVTEGGGTMGFLSGRMSFERFTVKVGEAPVSFTDEHVEKLSNFGIGRWSGIAGEGVDIGFLAGDHILDLEFKPEKNIIHDCLCFSVRIDTNKVPADLVRAYTAIELEVMTADNPSGYPSRQQRRQAKELAKERCRSEAQSGQYRRMKEYPVLWDCQTGLLYLGASSSSVHDIFRPLFRQAFGVDLSLLTAGGSAQLIAERLENTRSLDDLDAWTYAGPRKKIEVNWLQDFSGSNDFLGNEFFLWLWWTLDQEGDVITLSDETELSCMIARSLALECPIGETGKDTFSSDMPSRLPEAKKALGLGKFPRKAGLALVRHDERYELTLKAETLGVSSALPPRLESESIQARYEDRINQLRHLTETLDLMYEAFLAERLRADWEERSTTIREWLAVGADAPRMVIVDPDDSAGGSSRSVANRPSSDMVDDDNTEDSLDSDALEEAAQVEEASQLEEIDELEGAGELKGPGDDEEAKPQMPVDSFVDGSSPS